MEPAVVTTESDYIKTTTHNFISRQAVIEGAKQVEVKGRSILRSNVKLCGNKGIIRIGRYVYIDETTTLEPSSFLLPTTETVTAAAAAAAADNRPTKAIPMMIGNHTNIASGCTIHAAAIGSMVSIGPGVVIGERCILKDCCIVEPGVTLGNDTVVPPFTRISQTPTGVICMSEIPPSIAVELQEQSMDLYESFANEQRTR